MERNTIKKYLSASAIILGSFLCVSFIFAQYSGGRSNATQQSGQLYIPDMTDINKIVVEQERQEKMSELRLKINQIQNSQKRYLANKISNNIDFVHKAWSNHFNIISDDLEAIIIKIASRLAKAELNGKDVSKVKNAVENTKRSLGIFKSAVAEYESTIYVVDASLISVNSSSESGQAELINILRSQFRILKDALKEDTFSIRDGVMKDAKDNVRSAFLELADIPEIDKQLPIR